MRERGRRAPSSLSLTGLPWSPRGRCVLPPRPVPCAQVLLGPRVLGSRTHWGPASLFGPGPQPDLPSPIASYLQIFRPRCGLSCQATGRASMPGWPSLPRTSLPRPPSEPGWGQMPASPHTASLPHSQGRENSPLDVSSDKQGHAPWSQRGGTRVPFLLTVVLVHMAPDGPSAWGSVGGHQLGLPRLSAALPLVCAGATGLQVPPHLGRPPTPHLHRPLRAEILIVARLTGPHCGSVALPSPDTAMGRTRWPFRGQLFHEAQ